MSEIPFPMPLSVIFSPSHITNMVPATRITMDVNQKVNGETISGFVTEIIAPGTCDLKLTIYPGA